MKQYFQEKLNEIESSGLKRFLKTVYSDQGPDIVFEGNKYLNFSSNNYLGLANHPKLKEAAIKAVQEYGTGSGASRLITGNMGLCEELEAVIADFKEVESCLVYNSGYHANIGVIPALLGKGDVVFSDELNHASLIDGCRLSSAKTEVYRHSDMDHLEEILSGSLPHPTSPYKGEELPLLCKEGLGEVDKSKRLIVTDTVFSMDGDLCQLPEIMELAQKYDAWVLVDEAHATGVFGKTGRGVVEHFGIQSDRIIQMGTLGKALGSFGAYVCGSTELREYLINRSRSFIYTTALPPAVLGASLASIKLIREDGTFKQKLWENVEYFKDRLSVILSEAKNLISKGTVSRSFDRAQDDNQVGPIIPIVIGDAEKTMKVATKLFEAGIWATGIRPPTVAEGTSRIRLTIMSSHTREQLDRCLDTLSQVMQNRENRK